jgi:hypothetical protein
VMPVTLTSFTGEKRGSANRLTWNTATEINNAGFELQRSTDGRNFSQLAFVKTRAVNGNSTLPTSYTYDDVAPLKGGNYYRLKQVDINGRATFTNVVLLKGDKATNVQVLALYPNPVKDLLNVKVESPAIQQATLVITDAAGKVVIKQPVQLLAGETSLQLPATRLAQGTYFIKLTCNNGCESAVQKFIKE